MAGMPRDVCGPVEVPDSAALARRTASVLSACEAHVPSVMMAALVPDPGPGFGAGPGRGPAPPARACRVYAVPPLGGEFPITKPKGGVLPRPARWQPPPQEVKAEPEQALEPSPGPGQPRRRRAAVRALALIKGELSGSDTGGGSGDDSDGELDSADDNNGGRQARRMRRARMAGGCSGGSSDEAPGGWSARERESLSAGALRALNYDLLRDYQALYDALMMCQAATWSGHCQACTACACICIFA